MKNDYYKEKYEKLLEENKALEKSIKTLTDRMEYLEEANYLQEKIINNYKKIYEEDFKDENSLRPKPSLKFDS